MKICHPQTSVAAGKTMKTMKLLKLIPSYQLIGRSRLSPNQDEFHVSLLIGHFVFVTFCTLRQISYENFTKVPQSPIFHAVNNHKPGLMTSNLPGNDGAGSFDIDIAKLKEMLRNFFLQLECL